MISREAKMIGAGSMVQAATRTGVDSWTDQHVAMLRKILTKMGCVTDKNDDLLKIEMIRYRKAGLLGGIASGKNNSMPLQKCQDKLDALLRHHGIKVEPW